MTKLELFEGERRRLVGLAYRMLGSISDAEDVVQEAWMRWSAADEDMIERPQAWLTTVTTRLALDRIRAIERRREHYVGPWLPEPVATGVGPEEANELADSLTFGFLVLLDRLGPVERAVFLLADVFGEPYSVIAAAVGKTEAACRQIASRARRRLRAERAERTAPLDRELLSGLVDAVMRGDVERLLGLLDADVVLVGDAGPKRHAARRPVIGAFRVARFLTNVAKRAGAVDASLVEVNGSAALVVRVPDGPIVLSGDQRDGKVVAIRMFLNPDKLGAVESPAQLR